MGDLEAGVVVECGKRSKPPSFVLQGCNRKSSPRPVPAAAAKSGIVSGSDRQGSLRQQTTKFVRPPAVSTY